MAKTSNKFVKLLRIVKKEGHIQPGSPLEEIIEDTSNAEGAGSGVHSSKIKVDGRKITLHGRVISGESKE